MKNAKWDGNKREKEEAHEWMNRRNVLIFIRRNENKNENEHARGRERHRTHAHTHKSVFENGKVLIRLE